jgi:peptidylprolyl isomerase
MKNPFLLIFFLFSSLFAEEDIQRISEALGHIICKNLKRIDVELDLALVIKGMQDGALEKEPPMTERECVQALELVQEKNLRAQSKENLVQADSFLARNANDEGICSLERGKVQYRIIKHGNGNTIKPHFVPLIRYTIKKLDGSAFGPPEEEPVSLDETIPGLKSGLIGMKEGEERILYIHPDLAYGQKGALCLPPNLLLVFEVEILKADIPNVTQNLANGRD